MYGVQGRATKSAQREISFYKKSSRGSLLKTLYLDCLELQSVGFNLLLTRKEKRDGQQDRKIHPEKPGSDVRGF